MSAVLGTQTAYAEQEVYDRRVECDKRQEDEALGGGDFRRQQRWGRLNEKMRRGKTGLKGQKRWEGLRLPTHINHAHKRTINTYFTYCNYLLTSYIHYVVTFF